ncbi:MAG TPA: biotin/lipoyl-containing protein, partial [Pseudonocardiaceae bacterium]|nr:biotin/lipoyl-containing protein [Pseudonocardiaceae bacterium]
LADAAGNVVVVSTRDCSLQRRYQKLVEEAPAPFLTEEQTKSLYDASKAICAEAHYCGAGTVEYLVGTDGTISFLEVNTRLQVEHPVSEETAGIDLVREQFRIAAGEPLRFTEDPAPRGHSIEFRINGEDAGRNFLPAPGTVTRFVAPEGPGVRVDSGVESGSVIGGAFDSLLAKVIVTGADRTEALERSRRVLDEMVVEGMATVLSFHRAVVRDPAFVGDEHGFTVHTRWIETEFDNTIPPFDGAAETEDEQPRQTVVVEVGGRRLEVSLPGDLAIAGGGGAAAAGAKATPRRRSGGKSATTVSGDAVAAPMQGTIVKVAVADGQRVEIGELVVVLEAMKMENPVTAHKAGTVSGLAVSPGDAVTQGTVLLEITD